MLHPALFRIGETCSTYPTFATGSTFSTVTAMSFVTSPTFTLTFAEPFAFASNCPRESTVTTLASLD